MRILIATIRVSSFIFLHGFMHMSHVHVAQSNTFCSQILKKMPAVVKHVTLKFIKSIMVEFCPWEANAQSARQFLSRVRSGPVSNTNPKCLVKSKVKHDGSDPAITVLFDDGKQVLFKSSCLSSIEVLQRLGSFNKQREKAMEPSATGS